MLLRFVLIHINQKQFILVLVLWLPWLCTIGPVLDLDLCMALGRPTGSLLGWSC